MRSYSDLAAICRGLDARADKEGEDTFPNLFKQLEIDEGGAVGVAHQRALRAYLAGHGRELPVANEPVAVHLPEGGMDEIDALTSAWLDGFLVGLTLMKLDRGR